METDNNLPSSSTSSQENTNQQIPVTNQNEMQNAKSSNRPGIVVIAVAVIVVLLIVAAGGYFFVLNKKSDTASPSTSNEQTNIEPTKTTQLNSQGNPSVLALENGELFSIQISDLASKKLTSGGGFATTNQYGYWYSPDQTKLVSKQNKTLLLITKDGSKPILQTELTGDVNGVAWRSDSNALAIWQVLKYEETGMGLPTLSELVTYDLDTGKVTKVKQFNGYGSVAIWDRAANTIGYTLGGGEGGAFGDYHTLNVGTNEDKVYKTRWINPSTTPDRTEFIVFDDYDEQGNSNNKTVKIYSLLNPDKPLRTFPSPKDFFRCSPQIASNSEHPSNCLGVGKSFWFVDGSMLKSFNTQSGSISDITTLPTVNVDVPSRGNVPGGVTLLDVSKDQKTLLIEQQITFNKSEYKTYDMNTKQAKSLGFTKGGTTQPQGTTGQEGEFWTHEAIGFLY